jgi:hypothetical protein
MTVSAGIGGRTPVRVACRGVIATLRPDEAVTFSLPE